MKVKLPQSSETLHQVNAQFDGVEAVADPYGGRGNARVSFLVVAKRG